MRRTERSKLRRLPNRGSHDSETIHAILDAALLVHVGFQANGQLFVIPTLYGREDQSGRTPRHPRDSGRPQHACHDHPGSGDQLRPLIFV